MKALNFTTMDLETAALPEGEGGREGGVTWGFPPTVIRKQAEGEMREALQLVRTVQSTAEFQEADQRGGGGVYMGVSRGREGGREGGWVGGWKGVFMTRI